MSDDTFLRCLKRRVKTHGSERKTRVVRVDDWAWRKGSTYGTIIVDLEQREVVDLFPERAAGMTADWFKKHPGVEIISRDRCGSFAQGAREGAPQARQIADRFHIVKNMREAIKVQLSRAPGFCARPLLPTDGEEVASVRDKHGGAEHRRLTRIANQHSRQAARGYTGSFSNLERLLAKWRHPKCKTGKATSSVLNPRPVDPATGRSISPIVAAALCIKPRGLLTVNQAAKVDALKKDWPEFATMRRLACDLGAC
jgi:transposase